MALVKQIIAWLFFTVATVNLGAIAVFYGMSRFHGSEMHWGALQPLLEWIAFSILMLLWHRWKDAAPDAPEDD